MLSKKLKKVILGFVTALCLTGSAMPVMADTVRFNVTVPGDPKSKRIPKFSSYGTLSCRSYQLENQHVFSETKDISRTAPSNKGKYKSWAKPHVYYFMSSHSSLNGMNVEGRYTP